MGDLQVRTVTPDDWAVHRAVRLEMLTETPDAYWTTYADVAGFTEADWRERIASTTHVQAVRDGQVVGSAGLWDDPYDDGTTATLVAMYVRPPARGQAVGEALVSAVMAEAARRGRVRVELEVTSSNERAIRLYQRMGFSFNGTHTPHPRKPDLEELGMQISLDPRVTTRGDDLGG